MREQSLQAATQQLTAALLPQLRAAAAGGGHADLLFLTSTAARQGYPGGSGYNAAKAAWDALFDKSQWEGTANGLMPPVQSAPQYLAGGATDTAATPGEVLFIMNYGLYLIGARAAAPNTAPPTYS